MPKIATYLSGKTASDFAEFLSREQEAKRGPARVTSSSAASYLIRKGLEAEKATPRRGYPRRGA